MAHHLQGSPAVEAGIDAVQSVGQHRHGVHARGEGGAVGMDVHPVGQAAHDEEVGHEGRKVCNEPLAQALAILRDAPRADHAQRVGPVQAARTAIEELQRRVVHLVFLQQARIVGRGEGYHAYLVFLTEIAFAPRTVPRLAELVLLREEFFPEGNGRMGVGEGRHAASVVLEQRTRLRELESGQQREGEHGFGLGAEVRNGDGVRGHGQVGIRAQAG